jgi:hypothetical protein
MRSLLPIATVLSLIQLGLLHGQQSSYKFTKLATLGEKAKLTPPPSGDTFHTNDFEVGGLNNKGDVVYGTDLGTSANPHDWPSTTFGEGVFLRPHGGATELDLGHSLGNAPGGGTFASLLQGVTALNDDGDAAYSFTLAPFGNPIMQADLTLGFTNSGVYRYSHAIGKVFPVVIPFVTPSPTGGTFDGTAFNTSLNNRGDLVFGGILGDKVGVFKADKQGTITKVVVPGDPMPGNATFFTQSNSGPWINDAGDIAFTAQLASDSPGRSSIYVKDAATGKITSIVRAPSPAPGGGTFQGVFAPVLNNSGDVAFQGGLSLEPFGGGSVYLHAKGVTIPVAIPGDSMPGGGHFVSPSLFRGAEVNINNPGEVAFSALLDTDDDHDGNPDTGLYVWSHGTLKLVARTGTVLPGIGTVRHLATFVTGFPPPPVSTPSSGAINNDHGEVFFCATLTDGTGVLLIATP